MKKLTLLIFSLMFATVLKANAYYPAGVDPTVFTGLIEFQNNRPCLKQDNGRVLPIVAFTADASAALGRLKAKDLLVGTGEIKNSALVLDKVYFVGLNQLLGVWSNPSVWLDFKNYKKMQIWPFQAAGAKSFTPGDYEYSIAPDPGSGWKIYLQGDSNIYIGTLTLKKREAQIEFYNSETGNILADMGFRKILIH